MVLTWRKGKNAMSFSQHQQKGEQKFYHYVKWTVTTHQLHKLSPNSHNRPCHQHEWSWSRSRCRSNHHREDLISNIISDQREQGLIMVIGSSLFQINISQRDSTHSDTANEGFVRGNDNCTSAWVSLGMGNRRDGAFARAKSWMCVNKWGCYVSSAFVQCEQTLRFRFSSIND